MSAQLEAWGVDRMSLAERLRLFHELWDNISDELERAPITQSHCDEIDRRLARHQANPEQAIPWHVVESEALARLR